MKDVIYLKQGSDLLEMTEQPYEYETVLQEKLSEHPRLLAGGQFSESGINRWIPIAREQSVPDKEGGNERWSADHLFVDQDGVPTIVEVKRSENTEIRRKVVGQMLDYVAHASLFWDAESLETRFLQTCEERGVDPEQTLIELIDSEEIDGFWTEVERNLRSKRIRLMFVADEIPSELKRVVEFLNETMESVEVLAVEVVQYVGAEETVFVPRLYGQTEEAKASASISRTGDEYVETEEELYADLEQKLRSGEISESTYRAFVDLYEFAKELGDDVAIGGAKNANFGLQATAHQGTYRGTPNVFTANVTGQVKIWPAKRPLKDESDDPPVAWTIETYTEFQKQFCALEGIRDGADTASFETIARKGNLERFKATVETFVEHCRDAEKKAAEVTN